MGVETSRRSSLPDGIDSPETRERVIKSWSRDNILSEGYHRAQYTDTKSTMHESNINKIGVHIANFFQDKKFKEVIILELMAGNCAASSIIHDKIKITLQGIEYSWIATDVITYPTRISTIRFKECDTVDAVKNFGEQSNILLLISPPPCVDIHEVDIHEVDIHEVDIHEYDAESKDGKNLGYADYYAIHDYVDQMISGQEKYIIFGGELGASDGSTGMYRYLMEHKNMKLVERHMLSHDQSIFGDPVEKELFIFAVKK
jgi:hypothetical protein